MRRGFRVAAWILVLLAVVAPPVILTIGALLAKSTEGFNSLVGWASIAAVSLAAGPLVLTIRDEIIALLARQGTDDGSQALPERNPGDHDQQRSPGELEAPPDASGLQGPDWSRDTLLPRNPTFTGRKKELRRLGRLLADSYGPVAVVAVRGLGGVGKSQLALEYAYRMRELGRYQLAGWVRADTPLTIAEGLADLAPMLGLPAETTVGETAAKVIRRLESRRDWLIVFDNAQTPDDLADMRPRGGGHVLITSRNRVWSGVATQVDLGKFRRSESVKFVSERSGRREREAAKELATELGDLPLALAQAAAYIDSRDMTIRAYLDMYRDPVLAQGLRDAGLNSSEYPASVAQTWLMSFGQLSSENPSAVDLLRLCAFLDPDDIDLHLLTTDRAALSGVLATVFDNREGNESVGALVKRSLVIRLGSGHLRVHRLVQAVTRDQLDNDQYSAWAERTLDLIEGLLPSDPGDYRSWPMHAKLAPHIEAVTGYASNPSLRERRIALLNRLGIYLSESEQLRAARVIFERVLAIREEANDLDNPEVAKTLDNLGAVRLKLGDLREARDLIERALAILKAAFGPDHLEVAKVLGNLGIIQRDLWELDNACGSFERALAIFREVYGSDHRDITHTFVHLGLVQLQLGELGTARASLEHALAISEPADRADHADAARALIGLSGVQLRLDELGNARASSERALEISEAVYGSDNPEVATALISLSGVQTRQGELGNARANLERAMSILDAAHGPDHPEFASALIYLGAVQLEQGELGNARANVERALQIRRAKYSARHPAVASALINLGVVQLRLSDLVNASANLQRGLEISEATYGPDHPEVASALLPLGAVQTRLGHLADARASLQRGLEISEATYGPDHPEVARSQESLAAVQIQIRQAEGDPRRPQGRASDQRDG